MLGLAGDARAKLSALDRAQAVIEFDLDGTILTANHNFLDVVGYSLQEIVGKHHSIFVNAQTRDSAEYRRFWQDLRSGKFQQPNISASQRAERKSGSRPPTTR